MGKWRHSVHMTKVKDCVKCRAPNAFSDVSGKRRSMGTERDDNAAGLVDRNVHESRGGTTAFRDLGGSLTGGGLLANVVRKGSMSARFGSEPATRGAAGEGY
jgi:hypothetical protein